MTELNNVPESEKLDKRPDVPEAFQKAFEPKSIQPRTGLGTKVIGTIPSEKEGIISKAINFGRRFFPPYDPNSKPPESSPHKAF